MPQDRVAKFLNESQTMTVGQLKELLDGFHDATPVYYGYASGDHWHTRIAGAIRGADEQKVKHSEYHQAMQISDEESDDGDMAEPPAGGEEAPTQQQPAAVILY